MPPQLLRSSIKPLQQLLRPLQRLRHTISLHRSQKSRDLARVEIIHAFMNLLKSAREVLAVRFQVFDQGKVIVVFAFDQVVGFE